MNRELGRFVYAAYPFALVGALIWGGIFFLSFTTESVWTPVGYADTLTLSPEQTYIYNVTILYEQHGPTMGYGTRWENGSTVIEEPPFTNTITSWKRTWISFIIELNGTRDNIAFINKSLVGPEGIIEGWGIFSLAAGVKMGIGTPEVTQGGTYRLSLQNMGLQDIHLKFTWELYWHHYEKPYFYYGIAALAVALVYPTMFLIKNFSPWRSKQQANYKRTMSNSESR